MLIEKTVFDLQQQVADAFERIAKIQDDQLAWKKEQGRNEDAQNARLDAQARWMLRLTVASVTAAILSAVVALASWIGA